MFLYFKTWSMGDLTTEFVRCINPFSLFIQLKVVKIPIFDLYYHHTIAFPHN